MCVAKDVLNKDVKNKGILLTWSQKKKTIRLPTVIPAPSDRDKRARRAKPFFSAWLCSELEASLNYMRLYLITPAPTKNKRKKVGL